MTSSELPPASPPAAVPATVTLNRPFTLPSGTVLPNRIIKSALSEGLGTASYGPDAKLFTLYRRWATGGMAVNISGNIMVDSRHRGEGGNVVVEDGRHGEALARWAEAAKSGGGQFWAQLNHPGRQAVRPIDLRPVAPSAVPITGNGGAFAPPRELSNAEIEEVIARFATAAATVVEAGFDGVQIHGAHGYLVSQFLSPLTNTRTDRWGGSPEKRRRFLLAVVEAVRERIGHGVPLSVKLNSADFQRGGFTEEDSLAVVNALSEAKIDLLEVSGGTYSSAAMFGDGADPASAPLRESTRLREAYFLDYADKVRRQIPSLPLMLTGGFRSADAMAEAITSGAVDLVGSGRPVAVNPEFARQILTGAITQIELPRKRSRIAILDSLAEIALHSHCLHRMATGKDPAPELPYAWILTQYIARNGRAAFRRERAR